MGETVLPPNREAQYLPGVDERAFVPSVGGGGEGVRGGPGTCRIPNCQLLSASV